MGFLSRLFGKSSTSQRVERQNYESALNLIIIYKGFRDNDEYADKYSDLEDELWVYECIGASGAMSSETAKQYGIPLPVYPEYPVIGIFDLYMSKGHEEGYTKPLFISSNKDEVKRFLKDLERKHSKEGQ
ncbi:hypothetical protein [Bacillus benzoevorans]|uniref:Uncharacterized protein n=1 Tax=Bacillus benzoevorans TaxID=1456 RepID=A0A7X0HW88_9BACI|nr:hypothetical protein [Bacillus benzoevorans]MBB6448013.1 hypothetical protein [Bacillus benzoevorans]